MPYDHITAFGTSRGNLSDDERMRAQQSQFQQSQASQLAALQAEIADRQAGRAFQAGEGDKGRAFEGSIFDKNAGLQKDLDASATTRAFGQTDRQMAPAMLAAKLERDKWDVGAPQRALQAEVFKQFMPSITGGGSAGSPQSVSQMPPGGVPMPGQSKFQMDPDAMMFMAMGGNPAEYMQNKRVQSNADRAHSDAEDARNTEIGTKLIASGKPEAVALGTHFLSMVKNSGFAGQDQATLKAALAPEMAPDKAIASKASMGQAFDELAALATSTSGSFDTAGGLEQIKTKMASLVKMMTDNGVPPEEATAYLKSELGKRVPAETGLRLGRFFPSISSVGKTRQAIGFEN